MKNKIDIISQTADGFTDIELGLGQIPNPIKGQISKAEMIDGILHCSITRTEENYHKIDIPFKVSSIKFKGYSMLYGTHYIHTEPCVFVVTCASRGDVEFNFLISQ